jgi:hypothetical protein
MLSSSTAMVRPSSLFRVLREQFFTLLLLLEVDLLARKLTMMHRNRETQTGGDVSAGAGEDTVASVGRAGSAHIRRFVACLWFRFAPAECGRRVIFTLVTQWLSHFASADCFEGMMTDCS